MQLYLFDGFRNLILVIVLFLLSESLLHLLRAFVIILRCLGKVLRLVL